MSQSTYYLTTPLYYVNAPPHLGHAYTTVIADVLARYHRLRGDEVFFLTGTDEHGQKIQLSSSAAGQEPTQFVESMVPAFKQLWSTLNVSYNYFIRTTDESHQRGVQAALVQLLTAGDIYKGAYEGWYCVPDETFWPSLTITPGKTPLCPECQRPVQQIKEENYFFRLGRYQSWLQQYIHNHPEFIHPLSRRNEVLGFLEQPLQDLCISRPEERLVWGIEMPSPPFESGYVTYVWFDALLNYITAVGYPDAAHARWLFWPADLHLIGKDILRPHAVYWPIMLHALGLEPPTTIAVHGWWLVEGQKMSKSRGNIVDPHAVVAEYGVDAYRYFLLREVPFGQDGTFSEAAMDKRYNSDLANDFGNLVFRTLTMIEKYFGGEVPSFRETQFRLSDGSIYRGPGGWVQLPLPHEWDFRLVLENVWLEIDRANKLIDDKKPWVLAKGGEAQQRELAVILGALADLLRALAVWLWPVMPATCENLWSQLGCPGKLDGVCWDDAWKVSATSGQRIQKGLPLFPRRDLQPKSS